MAPRLNRAGMVNRCAFVCSSGGLGDFVIGAAVDETHVSPVGLLTDGDELHYYRFHDNQVYEWGRGKFVDGPTPVIERMPDPNRISSETDNSKVDFPAVANTVLCALGPDLRIGVSGSHGLWTGGGVLQGVADLDQILNPDDYDTTQKSFVPAISALGGVDIGSGVLSLPTWDAFPVSAFARSFLDDANMATLLATIGALAKDGSIAMTGLLTLSGPPSTGLQAATKAYVDGVATGLKWKNSVRAASTANLTLSNTQTIDGVAVIAADRVLVKNQSSPAQNGIYDVVSGGAWTRAADTDSWAELVAAAAFVEEGTVNANTAWNCTVDAGGTLDTTAVTWIEFFGGSLAASLVLYDNSSSGLVATNVQDALDELTSLVDFKATIAAMTLIDVTTISAGQMMQVLDSVRGGVFKLVNASYTANGLTIFAPDVPVGNLHWARVYTDGEVNVLWGDTDGDLEVPGTVLTAAIALGDRIIVPPQGSVLLDTTGGVLLTAGKTITGGGILKGSAALKGISVVGAKAKITGMRVDCNNKSTTPMVSIDTGGDDFIFTSNNCYGNASSGGGWLHAGSAARGCVCENNTFDSTPVGGGTGVSQEVFFDGHHNFSFRGNRCVNSRGFAVQARYSGNTGGGSPVWDGGYLEGGAIQNNDFDGPVESSATSANGATSHTFTLVNLKQGHYALLHDADNSGDGVPVSFTCATGTDHVNGTLSYIVHHAAHSTGQLIFRVYGSLEPININGAVRGLLISNNRARASGDGMVVLGKDAQYYGKPQDIQIVNNHFVDCLRGAIIEDQSGINGTFIDGNFIQDVCKGVETIDTGAVPPNPLRNAGEKAAIALRSDGSGKFIGVNTVLNTEFFARWPFFINGNSGNDDGTVAKRIRVAEQMTIGTFEPLNADGLLYQSDSTFYDAESRGLMGGVTYINPIATPYPEKLNLAGPTPPPDGMSTRYFGIGYAGGGWTTDSTNTDMGQNGCKITGGSAYVDISLGTDDDVASNRSFFDRGIVAVTVRAAVLTSGDEGILSVLGVYSDSTVRSQNAVIRNLYPDVRTYTLHVPFTGLSRVFARATGSIGSCVFYEIDFDCLRLPSRTRSQQFLGKGTPQGYLSTLDSVAPTQLTADVNDYAPTGAANIARWRMSSDAPRNITGILAGKNGDVHIIENLGTHQIILKNASGSSSSANQFFLSGDITLEGGDGATLLYDGGSSKWICIGKSSSAGITDAELTAIAGLTSAANKGIRFTGSGTAALIDDIDATTFTYDGGTFTADTGTWTVGSGDQVVLWYSIKSKELTYAWDIQTTTTASSPTELRIALPLSKTAVFSSSNTCWILEHAGTWTLGLARIVATEGFIRISKADGSAFANGGTDDTYTRGQLCVAIN